MKQIIKVFIMLFMLSLSAHAADMGPVLSGVAGKVLNIVEEDGRWYPLPDWYMAGLESSDELKTTVVNSSGKAVASAVWKFQANYDGNSAKVGNFSKLWPTENYDKLQKLSEGDYTLQYFVNGKVVWETAFNVVNIKFQGKDHFRTTGFWKELANFYVSKNQAFLCFWIEGPTDMKIYTGLFERGFTIQLQIEKDGNVVAYRDQGTDHFLYIYPGKVTRYCSATYDADKMVAADGEYDAVAYSKGVTELEYSLAKLKVTIKDGKVVMNDALTGDKADPKRKIITIPEVYYDKNLIPVNIPPAK